MLQVKLYSFAGTLIDTISPKLLMGGISWTAQINGGQGEVKVKLNVPMSTTIDGDIIKIISTDKYNTSGSVVYTGFITKIWREVWASGEYVELTALGLSTLLGLKLFANWAKVWSLSSILGDCIDSANLAYPFFTKVIDSLAATGNFDFQYKSILEVINSVKETGWSWTVDGQGNFIWKLKANQTLHSLTLGKNIEKISVIDNTEQVRNKISIWWSGWTQVYQDLASIAEYGIRELYESKTDITSSGYASSYGQSKVVGVSRTLTVQIYDYDIYSIIPWQLITVRNTPLSIQNLQIYKVSYGNNKATLEVEKIDSIGQSVRN